jgi:hypothetical protein
VEDASRNRCRCPHRLNAIFIPPTAGATKTSAAAGCRRIGHPRADALLDRLIGRYSRGKPVVEWGIAQACHVFGSELPSQAFRAAQVVCGRFCKS